MIGKIWHGTALEEVSDQYIIDTFMGQVSGQRSSGYDYDQTPPIPVAMVVAYPGDGTSQAIGPEAIQSVEISSSIGDGTYMVGSTESARLQLTVLSDCSILEGGIDGKRLLVCYGYLLVRDSLFPEYVTVEEYEAASEEERAYMYSLDQCHFMKMGEFYATHEMVTVDGMFTTIEAYDRLYWLTQEYDRSYKTTEGGLFVGSMDFKSRTPTGSPHVLSHALVYADSALPNLYQKLMDMATGRRQITVTADGNKTQVPYYGRSTTQGNYTWDFHDDSQQYGSYVRIIYRPDVPINRWQFYVDLAEITLDGPYETLFSDGDAVIVNIPPYRDAVTVQPSTYAMTDLDGSDGRVPNALIPGYVTAPSNFLDITDPWWSWCYYDGEHAVSERLSPLEALSAIANSLGMTLEGSQQSSIVFAREPANGSIHESIQFFRGMMLAYAPSIMNSNNVYLSKAYDESYEHQSPLVYFRPISQTTDELLNPSEDDHYFFYESTEDRYLTVARPSGTVRDVIGQLSSLALGNAAIRGDGSLCIMYPGKQQDGKEYLSFDASMYIGGNLTLSSLDACVIDHVYCDFEPDYGNTDLYEFTVGDDQYTDYNTNPWHVSYPPDGADRIWPVAEATGTGIELDPALFNDGFVLGCKDVGAVTYEDWLASPKGATVGTYVADMMPMMIWAEVVNIGANAKQFHDALPVEYSGFELSLNDGFHVELCDRFDIEDVYGVTHTDMLALSRTVAYDGGFTTTLSAEVPESDSPAQSSTSNGANASVDVTEFARRMNKIESRLNNISAALFSNKATLIKFSEGTSNPKSYRAGTQYRVRFDESSNANVATVSSGVVTVGRSGTYLVECDAIMKPGSAQNTTFSIRLYKDFAASGTSGYSGTQIATGYCYGYSASGSGMHISHLVEMDADGTLGMTAMSSVTNSATELWVGPSTRMVLVYLGSEPDEGGSSYETYSGTYDVTPLVSQDRVLDTDNKLMVADVTVREIPFSDVDNDEGGRTATIGG